ncbi:hypothetical protein CBR_g38104 [Chara braunii]|uniref:Uncharacterized protein n=1 Tax=Chara braunii TaxID=69332 RepID=A0A388K0E4_CHABU|nr:hypothetical protein CBR_g38104 [Chara braunii]|eukprot:GBG63486.1 hypothetical protein CBR_g38104 [Chara braunii]
MKASPLLAFLLHGELDVFDKRSSGHDLHEMCFRRLFCTGVSAHALISVRNTMVLHMACFTGLAAVPSIPMEETSEVCASDRLMEEKGDRYVHDQLLEEREDICARSAAAGKRRHMCTKGCALPVPAFFTGAW